MFLFHRIVMNCTRCNSEDTGVIDSRPLNDAKAIRRRRVCRVCKHRFTTYEVRAGDPSKFQIYPQDVIDAFCDKYPAPGGYYNDFIKNLRSECFTNTQISKIIQQLNSVCHICFNSTSKCSCKKRDRK